MILLIYFVMIILFNIFAYSYFILLDLYEKEYGEKLVKLPKYKYLFIIDKTKKNLTNYISLKSLNKQKSNIFITILLLCITLFNSIIIKNYLQCIFHWKFMKRLKIHC